MTDEQIKEALKTALRGIEYDEESINIVRADRHNRASKVLAVEFRCDSLTFEAFSEVAGALMTPNITIEPIVTFPDAAGNNPGEFTMEFAVSLLKVTCRAPGDVSQLIVDGEVETLTVVDDTGRHEAVQPIAPDDCERDCGCGQPSAHEHDFEYPAPEDEYPSGELEGLGR